MKNYSIQLLKLNREHYAFVPKRLRSKLVIVHQGGAGKNVIPPPVNKPVGYLWSVRLRKKSRQRFP